MKSILSCIFFFVFCPFLLHSQSTGSPKSISFPDYGPVAFDSFWKLPDDSINEYYSATLSSRISTDHQSSKYFTQYFQADVPFGCNNSLSFRMPVHFFKVDPMLMESMNMANASGVEIGDIDIIFNVRFLKNFLIKHTDNKLFCYLTGEMHTAPTGRSNRQFTDVLKMLGALNLTYSLKKTEKHSLINAMSIGGGGWDDLVGASQKHAFKFSNKLSYKANLKRNQRMGAFFGGTYVYAEGDTNRGLYWKTGFFYGRASGFQMALNYGYLNYIQMPSRNIYQYELTAFIPIHLQP